MHLLQFSGLLLEELQLNELILSITPEEEAVVNGMIDELNNSDTPYIKTGDIS